MKPVSCSLLACESEIRTQGRGDSDNSDRKMGCRIQHGSPARHFEADRACGVVYSLGANVPGMYGLPLSGQGQEKADHESHAQEARHKHHDGGRTRNCFHVGHCVLSISIG